MKIETTDKDEVRLQTTGSWQERWNQEPRIKNKKGIPPYLSGIWTDMAIDDLV